MIFTSALFFIFFTLFFLLYWLVFNKNLQLQNLFVLFGSYLFYSWWDWRFLSIIMVASFINFILGIYIEKARNTWQRKLLLWVGLLLGIGGLILFKYYNFFIASFNGAIASLHLHINLQTFNLIIPLGLSYYTFRMISYLLDVEKGKIKATEDWVVFFAYVSFFPCLLAGPIDKARTFIPQLKKKREFNYETTVDGMRQVLWGLFKKLIIADHCAVITDDIFGNYQHLPGKTLLAGAFFYTMQMYADFSGYSDMAIGFSHMIGFNVTKNFNFPFFSQNIAEFWRKWHISLTSWLTEYVFTPLSIAFRNWGKAGLIVAIIINFSIVGAWHGARWTYILFGFMHGCYFIPLILKGTLSKKRNPIKNYWLSVFARFVNMLLTFLLVMLTFIVFRAENMQQAIGYYERLFTIPLFSIPRTLVFDSYYPFIMLFFISLMLLTEWFQQDKEHGLQMNVKRAVYRWAIYAVIIFIIGMFMRTTETPFIYFKF